ncbi:polyhydroxyalkanoate depolymerase [Paraburkholderia sp. EG285A]|uniref:polyhydroxyalkanoate depolymerase n=1 Tax=Paraburkholderia sp. EG285A TaxID=3237009 RepID=UPI0034D3116E
MAKHDVRTCASLVAGDSRAAGKGRPFSSCCAVPATCSRLRSAGSAVQALRQTAVRSHTHRHSGSTGRSSRKRRAGEGVLSPRSIRAGNREQAPVVLVVAPLSGHHATLLRDTVRTMLPDFDVYITDWLDARHVPRASGTFHLNDYVTYVQEFIDYLGSKVHVVAVCQSTVPVVGAVALSAAGHGCTPASVTLMGGPVDARQSPTVVNRLALSKPLDWFSRTLINTVPHPHAGAGRKVYPGFRQHMAFVSMNPDRHLKAHVDYYHDVSVGNSEGANKHRAFYDEYNAVLDMDAGYYLETVRVVFQDFALARGTWTVNGERVSPEAIRDTALITVEGENDDICGQGQTHAAHDLCTAVDPSRRYRLTVEECGHYGIFSGRRWRTHIYPQIRELIQRFDGVPPAATESEIECTSRA